MGEHINNQTEIDEVYLDCHLKSSGSTFISGYIIKFFVQRCEICTE